MRRWQLHGSLLLAVHLSILVGTKALQPTSKNQDCVTTALDVVFLVDGSGSICDSDPNFQYGTDVACNNWNLVLKFMEDFVNETDIGLTATRVGLVTFATTSAVAWDLNTYITKAELMHAIQNLPYPGGTTDTAGGLHMMRTQVFGVDGDRPYVNNTAIIITDGQPTNTSAVPPEIDAVHSQGIETYVIGVTNLVHEQTLHLLSSEPQQKNLNYFLVPDFNTIGTIRSTVQNAATCVTTPATVQPTSAVVPPTSLIPVTTPRPVLSSTSATQIISTIQIPTYGMTIIVVLPICVGFLTISCCIVRRRKSKSGSTENAQSTATTSTPDDYPNVTTDGYVTIDGLQPATYTELTSSARASPSVYNYNV